MSRKLFTPFLLIFLSAHISFSQTVSNADQKGISPEIRKDAVVLLRETSAEVNTLRTLENRISFSAELAGLMWFEDEKEARTMFQSVINDFRQLLSQYDAQINAAGISPNEEQFYSAAMDSSAQLTRKFMKAVTVRQQIATAISEHDPKLALEFFYDTGLVITHPAFRKQIVRQDAFFETRLLQQIAEKDVDTALKYGRKSLEKGLNYETFGLLKKIYDKDADKGISFGEDILKKVKSEQSADETFYFTNSLLTLGTESFDAAKGKTDKKPMFSEDSLRQIAELLAQNLLNRESLDSESVLNYIPQIERFAPSRAAQIRQKFKIQNQKSSLKSEAADSVSVNETAKPVEDSPEKLLENLGDKQISKEDREKSVSAARKIIGEIKDPNQQLTALSALALQVAKSGDKDTASKIMDESRSLISLPPKNYQDFMKVWMLASGYSQIDADKAFPILEDTVFRLNDIISAFIKVGEFMDVNGEIIDDGEIQVGGFGGEMTRDLVKNLGAADKTIPSLVIADFARTRALTNKFDRPEVRILAKMLVLRGVFEDEKVKNEK